MSNGEQTQIGLHFPFLAISQLNENEAEKCASK
jgi:hypothetical protein